MKMVVVGRIQSNVIPFYPAKLIVHGCNKYLFVNSKGIVKTFEIQSRQNFRAIKWIDGINFSKGF